MYHPPHITIGKDVLKPVHQFTYLGCAITSDARIDREVDNRLAKANSAFCRLYKRVWNSKHLKNVTKISVYRAVVLTTLLYGSESWVTYRHHLRLLERFHHRCLRIILKIHWSNFVTNVGSPAVGRDHQYRGYVAEVTVPMGRARLQNERSTSAQDCPVRRTLHWPS